MFKSDIDKQVPIYIAEIAPKNLRGGLTTLNQLMIVTGSSISFLLGSVVSWRTLALTGMYKFKICNKYLTMNRKTYPFIVLQDWFLAFFCLLV